MEEGVDGRLLDLCLFRGGLLSGIRSSVSPVVVALKGLKKLMAIQNSVQVKVSGGAVSRVVPKWN